jgi:uncharacterized protein
MDNFIENVNATVVNLMCSEFSAFDLQERLIALGVIGSLSHGTYLPDHIDDVDYMGIVIPPARDLIGLGQWQHWVHKKDEWDVVLYSLRKIVGLLLKSNPNVVGFLWLRDQDYAVVTPAFELLRKNKEAFVSKEAYNSFVGYAHGQLMKMERLAFEGYMGDKRKKLVEKFGYDCKNAAHCIRLLRMGIEFLETGKLNVWREDREELLRIKTGHWTLNRVHEEAKRLFDRAKEANINSVLPDKPDYEAAEKITMELHREFLNL